MPRTCKVTGYQCQIILFHAFIGPCSVQDLSNSFKLYSSLKARTSCNMGSSFLSFVLSIPMLLLCGANLSKSRKETSGYPGNRKNLTSFKDQQSSLKLRIRSLEIRQLYFCHKLGPQLCFLCICVMRNYFPQDLHPCYLLCPSSKM